LTHNGTNTIQTKSNGIITMLKGAPFSPSTRSCRYNNTMFSWLTDDLLTKNKSFFAFATRDVAGVTPRVAHL
jgi:hypothetical protein